MDVRFRAPTRSGDTVECAAHALSRLSQLSHRAEPMSWLSLSSSLSSARNSPTTNASSGAVALRQPLGPGDQSDAALGPGRVVRGQAAVGSPFGWERCAVCRGDESVADLYIADPHGGQEVRKAHRPCRPYATPRGSVPKRCAMRSQISSNLMPLRIGFNEGRAMIELPIPAGCEYFVSP